MFLNRIVVVSIICGVFLLIPHRSDAQTEKPLAGVKSIKCTFPLMAVGTWGKEKPEAKVQPASLVLQFDDIDAEGGTAALQSGLGQYDIVVRYANGYLHFIQSFLDGQLYITTVLEKKTAGGKLKAMHSRHEFTDISLPGFTSSPEQYYGECEVLSRQ